jgi:glycosyltransferase involved in cell wall biosynthesis
MATYNGEKHIKEQLSSILMQIGVNDELIISDDHSTDGTIDVINEIDDKRIIIFNNKGKGLIKNFENAITKASGDYIFLCDQDDIWDKEKVKFCIEDFKNGYDLVVTDCTLFNSDTSEIMMSSYFEFIDARKGIIHNIVKNGYMGCCMAFNQKVKDKVIPFPTNIPMHDSWIGIISELYFKVKFNNKKLVNYRRHTANASETGAIKGSAPFMKKIYGRFFLCYNLISHLLKNNIFRQ